MVTIAATVPSRRGATRTTGRPRSTTTVAATDAKGGPRKEDVLALFASAPSLRYLSDMSESIPAVEGQWHRIYLSLQSLLGQLKVQQNKTEGKTGWSLFGKK